MRLKIQCIYEPRGDNGLEGFQLGEYYYAYPKGKRFALYGDGGYMESCGKGILQRFFRVVEK